MLWLAACPTAHAQTSPHVVLVLAPCAPTDASAALMDEEVLALMRVELAPAQLLVIHDLTAPSQVTESALWLRICGVKASVARLTAQGPTQAQEIDLSDLSDSARARTVALVLSGLGSVRESSVELTPQEQPVRSALDPELAATPTAAPTAEPRRRERQGEPLELAALGEVRVFQAPFTVVYGPNLSVRSDRYRVGAVALFSRDVDDSGGSLNCAAGSFGYTLLRRAAAPRLGLDLIGELGLTWAVGGVFAKADARARRALWAAAALSPWLRIPIGRGFSASVSLATGYARGLRSIVDSTPVASTHGPFAAVSLGGTWGAAR